ncbi:MAG: lipocalin family protein [Candidatus Aphodosoma sp.]
MKKISIVTILFTLIISITIISCIPSTSIAGEWILIYTSTPNSTTTDANKTTNQMSEGNVLNGKALKNETDNEQIKTLISDSIQKVKFKRTGSIEFDKAFAKKYYTWFKINNKLIITGNNQIRQSSTNYSDTFEILTLTKDSLIISKDERVMYFMRKE